MAIITRKIDRFDLGIGETPRGRTQTRAHACIGFDALSHKNKLIPLRSSVSGNDGSHDATTPKNFEIAYNTAISRNVLYMLGKGLVNGRPSFVYKTLESTGDTDDLGDAGWFPKTAQQYSEVSTGSVTNYEMFVYYKRTARLYGVRDNRYVWSAVLDNGTDITDTEQDLGGTFTHLCDGLIHSKDDTMYFGYDNKIAKNSNGSWNTAALTLSAELYITSITEYGNYLAIACAPVSGLGKSVVYLWNRDTSVVEVSESIDFEEGVLNVIGVIDGILVGISLYANESGVNVSRKQNRLTFRKYTGLSKAKLIAEFLLDDNTYPQLSLAKQEIDSRLHFMFYGTINGATREGVWSIGSSAQNESGFSIFQERTPNNDTALTSPNLYSFIYVGDYLFQSFKTGSTHTITKTNSGDSWSSTSILETQIFISEDRKKKCQFRGATVYTEPLPTDGQITVKYRVDGDMDDATIWDGSGERDLATFTTDNESRHQVISESASETTPFYKEIQFRLESTGGAVITGFEFDYEEIEDNIY